MNWAPGNASSDPMDLREHTSGTYWQRSAAGFQSPGLGSRNSSPTAISRDHNNLADVWWAGTDGRAKTAYSNNQGLTWGTLDYGTPAGRIVYGTPGATAPTTNDHQEVYYLSRPAFGGGATSIVRRVWSATSGWSAWQSVATLAFSIPTWGDQGIAAASWSHPYQTTPSGRTDLWVPSSTTTLSHYYTNNSGASWSNDTLTIPSGFVGTPKATSSRGVGRVDLFYVRSSDGNIGHWYVKDGVETFENWGRPPGCTGPTGALRGADAFEIYGWVAAECSAANGSPRPVYVNRENTGWQLDGTPEPSNWWQQEPGGMIMWDLD